MNRAHCVHSMDGESVLIFFKHQRNYSSAVHAASERQQEYAKWKVQLLRIHSQSSHQ